METAVAIWSGGKESCLACYLALREGYQVTHLLNVVWADVPRTMIHGLPQDVVAAQAEAVGIPLVQAPTTWETYEEQFKKALADLRAEGVTTAVFGDIDIAENRAWDEKVCAETGLEPVLPLWGVAPEEVLKQFLAAGFEAVVVAVNGELLDEGWLGRSVDRGLVDDLSHRKEQPPVNLCGENGEYHTLVVDGPLFSRRLEITEAAPVLRKGYWFLDVRGWTLAGSARASLPPTRCSRGHLAPSPSRGRCARTCSRSRGSCRIA